MRTKAIWNYYTQWLLLFHRTENSVSQNKDFPCCHSSVAGLKTNSKLRFENYIGQIEWLYVKSLKLRTLEYIISIKRIDIGDSPCAALWFDEPHMNHALSTSTGISMHYESIVIFALKSPRLFRCSGMCLVCCRLNCLFSAKKLRRTWQPGWAYKPDSSLFSTVYVYILCSQLPEKTLRSEQLSNIIRKVQCQIKGTR